MRRVRRPAASRLRQPLELIKRRAAGRLRGEVNLPRLVEEGLRLGERVYVAPTAYLDAGHPWLIEIGDEALVGPWVIVLAHDTSTRLHTGHTLVGRVRIGRRVYLGHGAIVMPGSTVGDEAVITPGSVVNGDIPARALATGNPARVVSDMAAVAERHREAIGEGPVWPTSGWTVGRGIDNARKAAQREALADRCGYLRSSW